MTDPQSPETSGEHSLLVHISSGSRFIALCPDAAEHTVNGTIPTETGKSPRIQVIPRGQRLERETHSIRMLLSISGFSIVLEMCRQVASYGMKYNNDDRFPLPPSDLVFFGELIKFSIFFVRLLCLGSLDSVVISFAYVVPSTLYAFNNNIYFIALHFTTPPVWNILMQSRVLCTAVVYRVVFKKSLTRIQWFALFLLTLAIIVLQAARAGGSEETPGGDWLSWELLVTLGLALLGSVFAAIGPVYAEYLLKHDTRTFEDKQLQMYFFGSCVTGLLVVLHRAVQGAPPGQSTLHVTGPPGLVYSLVALAVLCSVVGGVVVAVIIKKLDNIVKLYTQAISSALTASACAVLFPRSFQLDASFLVSFPLTLLAIYLYEAKELPCLKH